jgi:hypothetical protein
MKMITATKRKTRIVRTIGKLEDKVESDFLLEDFLLSGAELGRGDGKG